MTRIDEIWASHPPKSCGRLVVICVHWPERLSPEHTSTVRPAGTLIDRIVLSHEPSTGTVAPRVTQKDDPAKFTAEIH